MIGRITIAILALTLAAPASAREVEYHRFGDTVYGSDGSKSHDFGGSTYITGPRGERVKCHEFTGRLICEGRDR